MKRIISLILALTMLLSCAALADSELKVTGKGSVYMQADRATASIGIRLSGEDLAELQQQANNTIAAVVEALKAAGMEEKDISTNYLNIYPQYDYSGEVERMVGYSLNNTLSITTQNIDNLGTYIDAAFGAGANTFDSIEFSADDTEARKQALTLAVQDAQAKAAAIAAASGMTLGVIEEINETNEIYYEYTQSGISEDYAKDAAAGDAGTTVRAARINVSAAVQVTYELK